MTLPVSAAPHESPTSGWRPAALVALLAVAAFASATRGGFVWDDVVFFPLPARLTEISNPLSIFRHGLWWFSSLADEGALYRPVQTLVTWALGAVIGNEPSRWHAFEIVLHALASVLVYLLARRSPFSAAPFAALCAGALFAVHPVHVEAVAYVGGYGHALLTCFALVAAHAQLSHARTGKLPSLVAAVASTLAALLTSEGGFAVPVLVLALDAAERRRWPGPRSIVAHLAAVALALSLRAAAIGGSVPIGLGRGGMMRAISFTVAYVRSLVVPWPQRILADLPPGGVAGASDWIIAALASTCVALLLVRARSGERSLPLLALAWILVPLAPLAAAALNANPFFAPRALYLPSVGVSLLVAWALRAVRPAGPARWGLAATDAAGLLACNVASAAWRDDLSVHLRMLEGTPQSARVRVRVAYLYDLRGDRAQAEVHWREALRTAYRPEDRAAALEGLAVLCGTGDRPDEAERLLRLLVAEQPSRASGWVNLGNVAFQRGDLSEAAACYRRALQLDPSNPEAAINLQLVQPARP